MNNRFMTNANYLAAMAHTGWAATILLGGYLLGGVWTIAILTAVGVPLAAWKEFYYDARYETPKQEGLDNWADVVGYVAGMALAHAIVQWGRHAWGWAVGLTLMAIAMAILCAAFVLALNDRDAERDAERGAARDAERDAGKP